MRLLTLNEFSRKSEQAPCTFHYTDVGMYFCVTVIVAEHKDKTYTTAQVYSHPLLNALNSGSRPRENLLFIHIFSILMEGTETGVFGYIEPCTID